MFESLSVPLGLKLCAAALVVGGAGVVTVDYVTSDEASSEVVADTSSAASSAMGFVDGEEDDAVIDSEASEEESAEVDKESDDEASDKAAQERAEADKAELEAKESDEKEEPKEVPAVEVDVAILWPEDDSHHEQSEVVFEGEVSAGASVFAGPYEATVNDDGGWRIVLYLSPGKNTTTITAKDEFGNTAEDSVTAWLDVEEEKEEPKEKEKEEEPKNVEFSAKQEHGSCDDEVPYDVFWGTATPNTVVQISSDFGSAAVEVEKSGHWEKKVYFENAPRGQAFAVTVTAENGSKTFEFIALEFEEEPDK